jgi:hypothetical protein
MLCTYREGVRSSRIWPSPETLVPLCIRLALSPVATLFYEFTTQFTGV